MRLCFCQYPFSAILRRPLRPKGPKGGLINTFFAASLNIGRGRDRESDIERKRDTCGKNKGKKYYCKAIEWSVGAIIDK